MGHLIIAFQILLTAFLVVATMLGLLFPRRPLLGVSQHWGLQLWWLGLLAALAEFALGAWWIAILSLAVALYWSVRLFARQFTRLSTGRRGAAPGDRALLRIVSANLLHGNTDHDRAIRAFQAADADILALCEVTPRARTALRALEERFPHALDTCAAAGLYGILILSRFPMTRRSQGIGDDPMPRHLAVDLDVGGRAIVLVAVHPTNPLRIERADRIPGEFDAIAAACQDPRDDLILIGDCNAAGWSHWARTLERAAGLANDGRVRPSWPVWLPAPLRLPLDHVWVRGRVRLAAARLGKPFGSDHLPLIADIGWMESNGRDE